MEENKINLESKIKGAVIGFAFGEALGYGTEFMTRKEAKTYYPEGLRKFDRIIRDAHRSQRKRGEPGNETMMLSLLSECILEQNKFDIHSIARTLKHWINTVEGDIPAILPVICNTPGWEQYPIGTAHSVWQERNITEASNEAIPRGIFTAIMSLRSEMQEDTRKLVLMTNDDSRCLASTMIIAQIASGLIYDNRTLSHQEVSEIGRRIDPRTLHYIDKAYEGDIDALQIDDEETQCWTRKTMAAGIWGFLHGKDASDCIHRVIDLGGDSDNNAAIAGSLAGMKYGYEALPEEKENMIGIDYLLELSERIYDYVEKREHLQAH